MAKLFIMCGVPGSGKSTWVKSHIDLSHQAHISRDEIRFSLLEKNDEYFSKEDEVYNTFVATINHYLEKDIDVFADATHLSKSSRRKLLNKIKYCKDNVEVIWIKESLETCLERNNLREGLSFVPKGQIKRMFECFEPPTTSEYPFKQIHIIENGNTVDAFDSNRGKELKMANIWFTGDTHFNHDKEFVWKVRGFNSVQEMNESIIEKWNSLVYPDDIVYLLGDVIMGELNEEGLRLISRLNGRKFLAYGNHDTENKIKKYKELNLFEDIQMGYRIKYKKKSFILTHYPTIVANGDECKVINLFGHTHQTENRYENHMDMFHVGMDSHNCEPIKLEEIIEQIKEWKIKENENETEII